MENSTDKERLLLKILIMSNVFGVRITTSIQSACNLITIACGRWGLVTDLVK